MQHVTDLPDPPTRAADGHKGTFGSLLIVGGSETMLGAPMLAARSAYRAGCGYVRVALPANMLPLGLSLLPEAVGISLDGDAADADRLADVPADAVVIGPGLGQRPGGHALLETVLVRGLPTVVDADGLNLLAARGSWQHLSQNVVLTPHPGEMKRLLAHVHQHDDLPSDDAGRLGVAEAAVNSFGGVLVLKGRRSIVTDGERYFVNTTGDATLAKAGSGDVLSGLIGSLMAQGMPPFEAAVLGVHRHGLAGELVGRRRGTHGGLATEVADAVADVLLHPSAGTCRDQANAE